MKQILEIGSTPSDEKCLQVGNAPTNALHAEALIFREQLLRQFNPEHTRIIIQRNAHDFGTYFDVAVKFDDTDENAIKEAFNIEANAPQFWDDQAKAELTDLDNAHAKLYELELIRV